jgi:hypothetical protein
VGRFERYHSKSAVPLGNVGGYHHVLRIPISSADEARLLTLLVACLERDRLA